MTSMARAITSACEATAGLTRASSAFMSCTIWSGVSSSRLVEAGLRASVWRWSMVRPQVVDDEGDDDRSGRPNGSIPRPGEQRLAPDRRQPDEQDGQEAGQEPRQC